MNERQICCLSLHFYELWVDKKGDFFSKEIVKKSFVAKFRKDSKIIAWEKERFVFSDNNFYGFKIMLAFLEMSKEREICIKIVFREENKRRILR